MIAEYDGNNNLLRKFIYGPGVDQPVSMIEVADSNATYYYHYDALGSVIALSDSTGDTVQTYEYSVYGEVYVEDANHTNPYMFAGRRYDIEIGLYYNRARYYNPYTGRFLQADPIGYGDGMNMYMYGRNNSINVVDPSGRSGCASGVTAGYMARAGFFIMRALGGEQGAAGWGEALVLFSQWVNGTGPDNFVLGRGNALVEELIDTYVIDAARQEFIEANAGLPLSEWTETIYDDYHFGATAAIKAGNNPALHFLGTFTVTITPRETEDGTETITVTNTVSWSSYWRWLKYFGIAVPDSWERKDGAMCGNMQTTLTWAESVLPVTAPSEWMGQLGPDYGGKWRPFNMYPQDAFVPGVAWHPDVGNVNVDIGRFYP